MKQYQKNMLLSLILCAVILFNCNTFRRDTYAVVAEAIAGGIAVSYTPEAAAAIAAIVGAMGVGVASSSDATNIFTDYINYEGAQAYGSEAWYQTQAIQQVTEFIQAKEKLADLGLDVSVDGNGLSIDVNQNKFTANIQYGSDVLDDLNAVNSATGSGVSYNPKLVGVIWNPSDWYKAINGEYDDNGGGDGGGNNDNNNGGDNNNTPTWKRVVAGIMAGSTALTGIGNSFYDFLHANGQQLADDSAMSFAIGNIYDLNAAFKSYIKANTSLPISNYDWVERHISNGGSVNLNRFNSSDVVAYDIYKSNAYYYCYYRWGYNYNDSDPAGGSYAYTKYETWYVVGKRSDDTYVICNGFTPSFNYNANGSFNSAVGIYSNSVVNTRFSSVSELESYMCSQSSNATDKSTTNNQRFAYRGSVSASDGNAGLRCHYAVDQTATEIEVPDSTELPKKLKVGDTTVTVPNTTPNVYDDPAEWQRQVEADSSKDGKVNVIVPKVDPDTRAVTYPYTPNQRTVNPDDMELDESTELSEDTMQTKDIFNLLYTFFNFFWDKLEQVITRAGRNLLKWAFVPPANYFEDKINEIRELHCSSAGTIHFDELEIPDIYWYPEGSSLAPYIQANKVLIVSNAFLRQHIDTFRLFITSFLYFLWLLNKLNHLLRLFGVVNPNSFEGPQSNWKPMDPITIGSFTYKGKGN